MPLTIWPAASQEGPCARLVSIQDLAVKDDGHRLGHGLREVDERVERPTTACVRESARAAGKLEGADAFARRGVEAPDKVEGQRVAVGCRHRDRSVPGKNAGADRLFECQ